MNADEFRFSADAGELDRARVHTWLSTDTYWAAGRTRELQEAAFDGSLNFGIFETSGGEQVAYARVVTDSATFAWLCDVYVDRSVRGRGVGVALIEGVCAALDARGLPRTLLKTSDAHGLYGKHGFSALTDGEKWMQRTPAS